MNCVICGRHLTNPLSILREMGPVCRQRDQLQEVFDFMKVQAIEGWGDDIECKRNEDGGIKTNVPRRIKYHSPDGFEWGYRGRGPADFALNILSIFIGEERARENGLYQKFKSEFVATLPQEGGVIPREVILEWLKYEGVEL